MTNSREFIKKSDFSKFVFNENDLCLFFKKDGNLYGATENGRITYARMKNPETKEDDLWAKEANFLVYDLEKTSEGNKTKSLFGLKDMKDIEVLSQEEMEKELKKKGKNMPSVSEDDNDNAFGEE